MVQLLLCHRHGIYDLSVHKVVTIEGVAQDEVAGETISTGNESHALTFHQGKADSSYLRIPLPKGCKAADITIENHYMDQELYVLIRNAQKSFYAEHALTGNRAGECSFRKPSDDPFRKL